MNVLRTTLLLTAALLVAAPASASLSPVANPVGPVAVPTPSATLASSMGSLPPLVPVVPPIIIGPPISVLCTYERECFPQESDLPPHACYTNLQGGGGIVGDTVDYALDSAETGCEGAVRQGALGLELAGDAAWAGRELAYDGLAFAGSVVVDLQPAADYVESLEAIALTQALGQGNLACGFVFGSSCFTMTTSDGGSSSGIGVGPTPRPPGPPAPSCPRSGMGGVVGDTVEYVGDACTLALDGAGDATGATGTFLVQAVAAVRVLADDTGEFVDGAEAAADAAKAEALLNAKRSVVAAGDTAEAIADGTCTFLVGAECL